MMNNEELILQRLDHLEATLAPMSDTFKCVMELKDDMTPLLNRGFKLLIEELQDVEMAFQLEDLFRLVKQGLRSIRNFSWSLAACRTCHPLKHEVLWSELSFEV